MVGLTYKERGLTLVEMLVALFLFGLITIVISSILTDAIRVQRYNLAHRELMDQTSFVMEYMTRHIRMAKKQTADIPFACIPPNHNYQVVGAESIRFVSYRHRHDSGDPLLACIRFYRHEFGDGTGQLREELTWEDGSSHMLELTSPDLDVKAFSVSVLTVDQQPLVQISNLEIEGRWDAGVTIRTSISQRDLNF